MGTDVKVLKLLKTDGTSTLVKISVLQHLREFSEKTETDRYQNSSLSMKYYEPFLTLINTISNMDQN